MYSEEQFLELTEWMKERFAERGITITKSITAPITDYGGECSCRKPEPGMILQAIEEYDIDPAMSVLIGDKESDIEAKAGRNRA